MEAREHKRKLDGDNGGTAAMHGGDDPIPGHGGVRGGAHRLREVKTDTGKKKREWDRDRTSSGHGGPRVAAMAPAEEKPADSALTLGDDGN
jgi:hypothetical protein